MKRPGLQQIWRNPDWRRKLTAALRDWNNALPPASTTEHLREAAARLETLLRQRSRSDLENMAPFSGATPAPSETPQQAIDRLLDSPSHRLAVYGSLAPGKKNHHIMAGMEGTWRKAVLRGSLHNEGWGAGEGFPGFSWDGTDTPVAAQVFASADLPGHWQRLDEFEGSEYRRILVPVEILMVGGEIEVCNVYELVKNLTTDEQRSGDRT